MSTDDDAPQQTLTRHDARNVTEAFLSVQASVSEVLSFCRELVAPSDGTAAEVVEVLTPSAVADLRTLESAVAKFIECVRTMRGYEQLFGAATMRERQRARMLECIGAISLFIERLSVKQRTRQFDDGAALAAVEANAAAERARELDALARSVAESFGYRDGSSLADDEGESSDEDSDYAPEHDDDDGVGLLAESDDDDAPEAKRSKTE